MFTLNRPGPASLPVKPTQPVATGVTAPEPTLLAVSRLARFLQAHDLGFLTLTSTGFRFPPAWSTVALSRLCPERVWWLFFLALLWLSSGSAGPRGSLERVSVRCYSVTRGHGGCLIVEGPSCRPSRLTYYSRHLLARWGGVLLLDSCQLRRRLLCRPPAWHLPSFAVGLSVLAST